MSAAPDQIRSIVERITPSDGRLQYVYERLREFDRDKTVFGERAFRAAAVLCGLGSDRVRHIVSASNRRGGLQHYFRWLDALPRPQCSDLAVDAVGYVYYARIAEHPYIIKIGFSRDPDERMKRLKSESRLTHVLERVDVGTMLDESVAHLRRRQNSLDREWFIDPVMTLGEIPKFFHRSLSRETVNRIFSSPNIAPHQSGGYRAYWTLCFGAPQ